MAARGGRGDPRVRRGGPVVDPGRGIHDRVRRPGRVRCRVPAGRLRTASRRGGRAVHRPGAAGPVPRRHDAAPGGMGPGQRGPRDRPDHRGDLHPRGPRPVTGTPRRRRHRPRCHLTAGRVPPHLAGDGLDDRPAAQRAVGDGGHHGRHPVPAGGGLRRHRARRAATRLQPDGRRAPGARATAGPVRAARGARRRRGRGAPRARTGRAGLARRNRVRGPHRLHRDGGAVRGLRGGGRAQPVLLRGGGDRGGVRRHRGQLPGGRRARGVRGTAVDGGPGHRDPGVCARAGAAAAGAGARLPRRHRGVVR